MTGIAPLHDASNIQEPAQIRKNTQKGTLGERRIRRGELSPTLESVERRIRELNPADTASIEYLQKIRRRIGKYSPSKMSHLQPLLENACSDVLKSLEREHKHTQTVDILERKISPALHEAHESYKSVKEESSAQGEPPVLETPQSAISALSQEIADTSQYREVDDQLDKALMKLRALNATVPMNMKEEFDLLLREGEALRSPESEGEKSIERLQKKASSFERKVHRLERRVLANLREELDVSERVAREILEAGQTGWESLIVRSEGNVIQQNHNIKGLKIIADPDGTLRAYYGLDLIGEGSVKSAKAVKEIGGKTYIRLTSLSKGDPDFRRDIEAEVGAREILTGIPNIANITRLQYRNKRGELKTRYFMEKYEGDLRLGGKKDLRKIFSCLEKALPSLQAMHRLGVVHGDLNPGNIFGDYDREEGYLADFGYSGREGDRWEHSGNLRYHAPETVFDPDAAYNQAMDMYSVGMLLLYLINQKRSDQWTREVSIVAREAMNRHDSYISQRTRLDWEQSRIQAMQDSDPEGAKGRQAQLNEKMSLLKENYTRDIARYQEVFENLHAQLQADLEGAHHPFYDLISDLINYAPGERPSSDELLQRYTPSFNYLPPEHRTPDYRSYGECPGYD